METKFPVNFNSEPHKSPLTALLMVEFDNRYLLATGVDGRIKIWKGEEIVCDSNINVHFKLLSFLYLIDGISSLKKNRR